MSATAIILAAGHGTRMRSALPKAMHKIGGRPMLCHLIDSCATTFDRIVVVVGPGMEALGDLAAPHMVVVQTDRRGTADAARQAETLFGEGDVAVLYADNPLIGADALTRLRAARTGADLALLAMRPPDPARYGRLIVTDGRVRRIVEYADASEVERAIPLCNAGGFCASATDLRSWLACVKPSANGEYYLTDIIPHATHAVAVEAPYTELRGVNTRAELAEAEATLQRQLRVKTMEAGATLTAPDTVFFAWDTQLGQDVTIEPHVVFGPGVTVGDSCTIRAFTHLAGCTIEAGASIGPYARLRPGTVIETTAHVGNFCELKATHLGAGAKVNHLTYLGDASIGPRTNIGAGTITCNYDGATKHPTSIGADVFVGSNTTLVAPLTIGDRAFIAAGSTITQPIDPDTLAFGRSPQTNKPGAATRLRTRQQGRA